MLSESQRAALAARLRRGRGSDAAGRIAPRPPDMTSPPASFGQEQLWFLDRFAPGQPIYNLPCLVHLRGPLDGAALSRALDALVARHEALRTRLVAGPRSRPVQVIDPPAPVPLPLVDLTGSGPGDRQARLREFTATQAARPFDLAAGPLLRAWLVRLDQAEHMLVAVIHHAVFDGWSAGVFRRDLAALYGCEVRGEPAGLPELAVQFADYAVWERDQARSAALAQLESYWRTALAGFETIQFPTDRPRPVIDSFEGGIAEHTMGAGLLGALRELSRRQGTTLFATVMAALLTLLHRYSGQTDLVVGTVSANRSRAALAPLIGFLVNTVPIRGDLTGDPEFTTLLARVKQTTVGAFAHQDLPFGKLVEALGVERDASRAPVFQIALTYAERDATPVPAAGVEFTASSLVVGIDAAKFDLTFAAEARTDGLWVECSYKTALFDAATIERLLAHLEVLLRGIVADPTARLSQLPLLTDDELHAELVTWNDTAEPAPAACVHEAFEAQARRTPDAPAAEFGDQTLSYAELNRHASQIARRLRGLGTGPEAMVGVCMRTGLRRLAALLGIWKAGGAYVPLDPAAPAERLAFMIEDTGMSIVLTDGPSAGGLPGADGVTQVCLDAEWDEITGLPAGDLTGTGVAAHNAAYVIYTSGSTGQPKGVIVEHRNAMNFLPGMAREWGIGRGSTVLQFSSFTFDVSVMDMFMPLVAGGTVVLAPAQTLHSPPRLAALMRDRRITFACLPPAVLSVLPGGPFPDLQVLMSAGEELPPELVRRWARPGLRFVNGYGPTEATVIATYAELAPGEIPPPIGFPTRPNYQVYVLDPHLNPVPVGVTGELHIGGASVARGYLNRPDLTRQRFIPDPFTPGQRLYKTGDLVKRRPDGAIVFLGRADNQVKIRGLRIELGEIEAALATHPEVAQAVAVVLTDHTGQQQLTAYLRPEPGAAPTEAALRDHLARTLPGYMIPAYLITVAEFPLNASGKVAKGALPRPQPRPGAALVAPATPTEAMLARLYATLLGTAEVGVTDSFFDLGGNSLSAMRLIDMIGQETGADIGVTSIFLHPTPRQLAASLDAIASGAGTAAGPLAELSTGVGELPLFMIHAVGGTVSAYTQLGQELGGMFKVYGLQAPALTSGEPPAATLAGLVSDYTERIRAAQPAGPYQLAGWSMGAAVAFELAKRLEQAGEEVSLLVLLDPPFAVGADFAAGDAELARRFVADAALSVGRDVREAPAAATVDEQLAWLAGALAGGDPAELDAVTARLRRRLEIFGAHSRLLAGYRPDGPAVAAPALIVSADRSPNAPTRELWPAVLTGPVSTLCVDSDHYAFLRPPLVADVAASILKWDGTWRKAAGDGF